MSARTEFTSSAKLKRQRQGLRPDIPRDENMEFTFVNDCFKNERNAEPLAHEHL